MSQYHLMQLLYQQEEFMNKLLLPFKLSKWASKLWFSLCSLLQPQHQDRMLINNQNGSSQENCHSCNPWKINVAVALKEATFMKYLWSQYGGFSGWEKKNANKTHIDQSRNLIRQYTHNTTRIKGISICNAIEIQPCDVFIWFSQYCCSFKSNKKQLKRFSGTSAHNNLFSIPMHLLLE